MSSLMCALGNRGMQLQGTAVGNYSLSLHFGHVPVEFTEAATPQLAGLVGAQLGKNLKQPFVSTFARTSH